MEDSKSPQSPKIYFSPLTSLTHGHQTETKKVSSSAIFYNSIQYGTTSEGLIDYAQLEKLALEHKPKLIILGASAYPREWVRHDLCHPIVLTL